jgi:hypothetical protein
MDPEPSEHFISAITQAVERPAREAINGGRATLEVDHALPSIRLTRGERTTEQLSYTAY